MRVDPWKLIALVLFVACVDEVVRPDLAHAPGIATQPQETVIPTRAPEAAGVIELPLEDSRED